MQRRTVRLADDALWHFSGGEADDYLLWVWAGDLSCRPMTYDCSHNHDDPVPAKLLDTFVHTAARCYSTDSRDFIAVYTGIKNLTLALNVDYGWEYNEASLVASGTRSNSSNDASSTSRRR